MGGQLSILARSLVLSQSLVGIMASPPRLLLGGAAAPVRAHCPRIPVTHAPSHPPSILHGAVVSVVGRIGGDSGCRRRGRQGFDRRSGVTRQ